jgi:TolB-like protein
LGIGAEAGGKEQRDFVAGHLDAETVGGQRPCVQSAEVSVFRVALRRAVRTAAGRVLLAPLAMAPLALAPLAPAAAQRAPRITDTRPTVAVFYFDNAALVDNAKYEPLRKGLATMIGFELARNPGVRVVERDKLQALLVEQGLQNSDKVDQTTAVKLGRLLGVRHFIDGTYFIDDSKKVRIDVRAVNVETGQWDYTETINGKADKLLDLVSELGAKINKGMKLPEIPIVKEGALPTSAGPNQERISQLISRAEEEMDRGNAKGAAALYKSVLELNKNSLLAQNRLASIEKKDSPGR